MELVLKFQLNEVLVILGVKRALSAKFEESCNEDLCNLAVAANIPGIQHGILVPDVIF